MDVSTLDYILKAIAILGLFSSIYLLIKNFEPKSIITKLLYATFTCTTIGLALSLCHYFLNDTFITLQIRSIAEFLYDIATVAAAIAAILRFKELLPFISIYNSDERMKKFENGIKICIGIIIFCYMRILVARIMGMMNYKTGLVYLIFYSQAGLMFYIVCMLSDLIACTWITSSIMIFISKRKRAVKKPYGLVFFIVLLYIAGIMGGLVGALSANQMRDKMDSITGSVIVIYYVLVIRVLVEMKKLCTSMFNTENSTIHANQANNIQ